MTQKERVVGLFEFLMDLLDEKETKQVEEPKLVEEPTVSTDTKQLQNPRLPHHPLLNPYINSDIGKPKWVDNSLELMGKIATIDKERAEELAKIRIVDNATRPLIKELQDLKKQGHENALEVKEAEELETIVSEVGDKLGITLENGKVKLVNVPNELRDNIPLDESELVNGGDDLPKHVSDKLGSSKMPSAIKEAMMSAPDISVVTPKKTTAKKPTIKANNRKKK